MCKEKCKSVNTLNLIPGEGSVFTEHSPWNTDFSGIYSQNTLGTFIIVDKGMANNKSHTLFTILSILSESTNLKNSFPGMILLKYK